MNPDLNAMLAEHEGFLRSCANDWLKVVGESGLPDLLQEGRVALVLAAKSYDPERGVKFLSYAGRAIKTRMHRWVMRMGQIVKLPSNEKFWWVGELRLDAPVFAEDGKESSMHAVFSVPVESLWAEEDAHVQMQSLFSRLDEREQRLLRRVFWDGQPLRSLPEEFGLSYARLQQIASGALGKLRRWMNRERRTQTHAEA
jgi:RNA polymerase sigma factor (sigma-70 family)